jgi:transcriptional regulator with XRE-family HTH domain
LAENCELSNNFVALIERGRKTPSIETLDKLADALDVQLSELFAFDAPAKATSDQERVVKKILKLNGKRDLVLVAELIDRLLRR